MKRVGFLVLVYLFGFAGMLPAQNPARIKADPDMIWAEGAGSDPAEADRAALEAMVWKIAHYADFRVADSRKAAVAGTYLTELRRRTQSYYSEGTMLRFLTTGEVQEMFLARERRSSEIREAADAESDKAEAARMYRWAWSYLASLPGDHRKELSLLKNRIRQQGAQDQAALPPVIAPMRHIAREADLIIAALGEDPMVDGSRHSSPEISLPSRPSKPEMPPRREGVSVAVSSSLSSGVSGPASVPRFHSSPVRVTEPSGQDRIFAFLGTFSLAPEPMVGGSFLYCRKWGMCLSGGKTLEAGGPGDFAARSDGTAEGRFLWPDGTARTSGFFLTAGPSYRIFSSLSAYMAAGYGDRSVYWRDQDGTWARISDKSVSGPALETGSILKVGPVAVSIAARTVFFRTLAVTAGVGCSF